MVFIVNLCYVYSGFICMYIYLILVLRKNILLKKYIGYKFVCICMYKVLYKNGVKFFEV